jgi:uncharacterized protein YbcI
MRALPDSIFVALPKSMLKFIGRKILKISGQTMMATETLMSVFAVFEARDLLRLRFYP